MTKDFILNNKIINYIEKRFMERGVEAQIGYLLDNQLIRRISKNKLNINGKGRIYNQDKPPSKILTKVVDSLYKKQFPQESKPKRRIRNVKDKPAGSADVDLKYDEPNDYGVQQVNQDRFSDFMNDYEALQNKQTNPLTVELKFRIETQKPNMAVEISEMFIKQETVYGGLPGLKLYIKTQVIKLVYMFEDSGTYIKNINLTNMYVSKRNQSISIDFRQIRMYGTLYNLIGYGLDAKNYDGACVPNYLLATYNNQEVTNPRNKISKLDMPKLLEILGMQNMYEGCTIEQIANFCNMYKITYYVMNFRYKLFETNSNPKNNRHHKTLVFLCSNNHLYPIEQEEDRQTIFKKYASSIGGGIKKMNIIKKEEEEYENMNTDINIIITGKVINEDGIVTEEHFLDNVLIDELSEIQGRRRVVFTEPGSVHRLFYSEIEKGNIYNDKIKTSKGNIVAFSIDDDLHIEENPNIESVLHIIDKLNRDSVTKYKYMGQSLYSLAYEYFTKRHDRNIVSYCSPQVYNILKNNINSPFLEFYKK